MSEKIKAVHIHRFAYFMIVRMVVQTASIGAAEDSLISLPQTPQLSQTQLQLQSMAVRHQSILKDPPHSCKLLQTLHEEVFGRCYSVTHEFIR